MDSTCEPDNITHNFPILGLNKYRFVFIVPKIAIDIRRIRDFRKDWKWIILNFVLIVGWIIWFIWLGFEKSGTGKNKFIWKMNKFSKRI